MIDEMQAELDDLAELIEQKRQELRIPGVAVGVHGGGSRWLQGFGVADVERGTPFTPESIHPVQSLTKPFTAAAIMSLVERGTIDLDERVRRYLPDFAVRDTGASEAVTVRHLLTHTAGWVGDLSRSDSQGDLATTVSAMRTLPQLVPPGQAWSYCNAASVVAGRVLEVVTGLPYPEAVRDLLLAPLGLQSSFFATPAVDRRPDSLGHRPVDDGFEPTEHWMEAPGQAPAGGLLSSVADQLRWLEWWLNAIDVALSPLSEATRAAMLQPQIRGGNICDAMGIGWLLVDYDRGSVASHWGSGEGIENQAVFAVERQIAVVVLTNADSGVVLERFVCDEVLRRFAGLTPRLREPRRATAVEIASYEGRYANVSSNSFDWFRVRDAQERGFVIAFEDESDPAAPPTVEFEADVTGPDEITISSGPFAGARGEFLRDDDGVWAARFGARICPRDGRLPSLNAAR
jgi:CubicO group peptidase (beta-lactamase class C family)